MEKRVFLFILLTNRPSKVMSSEMVVVRQRGGDFTFKGHSGNACVPSSWYTPSLKSNL